MSDLILAPMWLGVLAAGVLGCLVVRAAGLASTYVRDLLHVGAGVWIVGWPWWSGPTVPTLIVAGVAVATAAVAVLAASNAWVERFERSVAAGDERFEGLIWYTGAYALLTGIGLSGEAFPAAAALLALSLGDGVGGAIGRRFGRHTYRAPRGKRKSLEGSVTVFVAATVGVFVAAAIFGVDVHVATACALGAVAAVAEAVAPRGTDNAIVPASVFVAAHLLT